METQDPITQAAAGTPERKRIFLIRHGQTTYNVEGRLPGHLPGVALTDEGRRQAHVAAVALAAMPLTAVVSSPLERARDTADIIARGWNIPVRLDTRLMDTDVGPWAGQRMDDLEKHDPAWKQFVRHPTQPPPGVESLAAVMERAGRVIEELRHDPTVGSQVALVAHADVIKLIVAQYLGIQADCAPKIQIDNASITALGFAGDGPPAVLALNWTPAPSWLAAAPRQPLVSPQTPERVPPDGMPAVSAGAESTGEPVAEQVREV
jgi:probable phosphoglycerate mutase